MAAVAVEEVGMEVGMEVEVGPQTDETTGEYRRLGDGGHGGVRGDVRGDVHDESHACVDAYDSLRGHASQPCGRLHHPAGWRHHLELPEESRRHTRRNEGDHLATRGHGRDERVARTLPLNGLPYQ